MLMADRHRKIVELVEREGSVRVSELSELFQVTEETIRRDLDKLESEGKILRTHGGAVRTDEPGIEIPVSEREIERIEQKRAIAAKAIEWVEPGDQIILDASTTAWQMAKILPDIPLIVVTNSVKVIMELAGKDNIQVISVGGNLAARSLSFVGPLAERSLDNYHVRKLFMSCGGCHLDYGISEATEEQARVKAKMIANADDLILLVDSSKFQRRAFTQIAPVETADVVITDAEVDPGIVERMEGLSISVHIVQE
ncbi:MAG: DeoR/GlpR family DNA-binding transcription regulator [Alicyclobacillus herbarius]|uniref:DeoR/GlpR family DNA-binding transcription regulator n=1 Tax=Alicyclobacillus herbarius TaxID=122960 RepID=UPI002356FC2B|nr:DeoR/GlpR family DNA-binding transcription regulator [Alicyclobacillus herbarius]MCL6631846.1 DeoR/GlpR family DNA-binding transcription regulator [Alicyclobacillus herbarius]